MTADEQYISGEEFQARRQTSNHSRNPNGYKVTVSTRLLGIVAAVIILCGLSFYGGVSYQKHHAKATPAANTNIGSNGAGGFGGSGARRSGGFGQVTAVSSTSITVSNQRTGASTTYSITSSTTITDSGQSVTTSDIQTGDTVLVTTSGSGSTTATAILVNPSFGGGLGGSAGSGSSGQAN